MHRGLWLTRQFSLVAVANTKFFVTLLVSFAVGLPVLPL
jgi:hypothetical protein